MTRAKFTTEQAVSLVDDLMDACLRAGIAAIRTNPTQIKVGRAGLHRPYLKSPIVLMDREEVPYWYVVFNSTCAQPICPGRNIPSAVEFIKTLISAGQP